MVLLQIILETIMAADRFQHKFSISQFNLLNLCFITVGIGTLLTENINIILKLCSHLSQEYQYLF